MEVTATKTTFQKYLAYKDSGAPWIGEIPSHWKTEKGKWLFIKNERPVKKDNEIVTCFRDGEVTLRKNRKTEGFTNALKEHGYQGIRKGDLVIHAMDSFAGAIGVSDSDGKSTPVYSACTERFANTVNQYYYAYFLRNLALNGVILSLAKGIRERSTDFRFNDFGELILAFPPLPEQTAIANFLDDKTAKIDRAIAQKERLIALLKERKQIIIQNAVTKGLDPNVKLKDSGVEWIGKIPEHWEVKKLTWLTSLITQGGNPNYNLGKESNKYRVLKTKSLYNDVIHYEESDHISEQTFRSEEKSWLQNGDLLVAIVGKGSIGKVNVFSSVGDVQYIYSRSLGCIRFHRIVNPHFVKYLFQTEKGQEIINLDIKGSTGQEVLQTTFFKNLKIHLPPLIEQDQIVKKVESINSQFQQSIILQQTQIEKLKEYKATLIDSAVTGKIKVC